MKALPAIITGLAVAIGAPTSASAKSPWIEPESNWGGAAPLNQDKWYSYEDYPEEALRRGQEGYVTVAFTITPDGRMTGCHVIRSSGSRSLDAVPCWVLPKRARFSPAKDGQGQPLATHGETSMSFWTPK